MLDKPLKKTDISRQKKKKKDNNKKNSSYNVPGR